jgi:hypothetical protein
MLSPFDGQLSFARPSEDRGIPAEYEDVAVAYFQRAIEDFERCSDFVSVICKDKSGDRKRLCIVIAERNRRASMVN